MDYWDRWLNEQVATPFGGLLIFVLLYVMRILVDRWDRKAESKKRKRGKEGSESGGSNQR